MMKTKLSPLEELRSDKLRLEQECSEYEKKLIDRWGYTRKNFGRLLFNSVLVSGRSGFSSLFSSSSGKKDSKKTGALQIILSAAPFVWDIIQPMLIGLLVKRVKSIFKRKKK